MWRAICEGRDLLRKGLIKRVGNGRTTEIWHDRWIARTAMMKPVGRIVDTPMVEQQRSA